MCSPQYQTLYYSLYNARTWTDTRNTKCNAHHFALISGTINLILAALLNTCPSHAVDGLPSDHMNYMILASEWLISPVWFTELKSITIFINCFQDYHLSSKWDIRTGCSWCCPPTESHMTCDVFTPFLKDVMFSGVGREDLALNVELNSNFNT